MIFPIQKSKLRFLRNGLIRSDKWEFGGVRTMTGEEFVKLCYEEKESILKEYFREESGSAVAEKVRNLIQSGTNEKDLFELMDSVMTESYYTLLLGLDGAASLGGKQISYQIYDKDGILLNECGEIEESAFNFFMKE